jgi:hypothetical protein
MNYLSFTILKTERIVSREEAQEKMFVIDQTYVCTLTGKGLFYFMNVSCLKGLSHEIETS